jgi:hypothetical protein
VEFLGLNKITNNKWTEYYEFYEFIPDYNTDQVDGVIDWKNPQTSLSKSLSTNFEWIAAERAIDRLFSYDLYAGLGIFPRALA